MRAKTRERRQNKTKWNLDVSQYFTVKSMKLSTKTFLWDNFFPASFEAQKLFCHTINENYCPSCLIAKIHFTLKFFSPIVQLRIKKIPNLPWFSVNLFATICWNVWKVSRCAQFWKAHSALKSRVLKCMKRRAKMSENKRLRTHPTTTPGKCIRTEKWKVAPARSTAYLGSAFPTRDSALASVFLLFRE